MSYSSSSSSVIDPAPILQQLIRFDTTNPPGNEAACIDYVRQLLNEHGCDATILARDASRPNLVSRLKGSGQASPLLLYGHVDVVTTAGQSWTHPPFDGAVIDDHVWGRGALDMKGGVAMMLAAFLQLKANGVTPPGDVILAIVSDEEAGGDYGARFLVEEHPELFAGVRHALGEFGGFSIDISGKRFYPIQVAEKQVFQMRAIVRGVGGHGSIPVRKGAMAKAASILSRLDRTMMPPHITDIARRMIDTIADALGFPQGLVLRRLLQPQLTHSVLKVLGRQGEVFEPVLCNTVNATMIRGGERVNVVPNEVEVSLDCRLVPGFGRDEFIYELRRVIGDDVELETLWFNPGPERIDMEYYDSLAAIVREMDPEGIPLPNLLSGTTDGRFFSRLGIQTYGFLPMPRTSALNFPRLIHGPDERVPVESIRVGAEALFKAIERYGKHR